MSTYVLGFDEIDRAQVAVVGGKGAHLGELSRMDGVHVPPGFCVTTAAYERVLAAAPSIDEQLHVLAGLTPDGAGANGAIGTRAAEVRRTIEATALPDEIVAAIDRALGRFGGATAFAVRSSATAEDLPTASFAGQQDSYLNVVGRVAVLDHVRRCWASLFTERAVSYRLRNGFARRRVQMAVVVQQMVVPHASGVLFTADPVSGSRTVSVVEACLGLGEALVSGTVNSDSATVRDDIVITSSIATKRHAIRADPAGGTHDVPVQGDQQDRPALTAAQTVRLVRLGRRIESHLGRPQDIEWCLVDDDFQIVQSRPITTLFPVPAAADDAHHVYVSVGHQQMMTDPMTPLGISVFQLTALPPMHEAAGRLFVDVTGHLGAPTSRAALLELIGRSEPLIADALQTILDRGDFVPTLADPPPGTPTSRRAPAPDTPLETDPAIVDALIERTRASVADARRAIRTKTGASLLDFILDDIRELKRILFDPQSHQVIMEGFAATWWLNDHLLAWLGETNAADALTQSVSHNVTSEMGLALLDVADVIRAHPDVVAFLERVGDDDGFLDDLTGIAGGQPAHAAIQAFLDEYGMRCVGEIDITRPRWSERPTTLVPIILGNVRNFEPGAAARRFERGRQDAWREEQEVLARLRLLLDGEHKASETKRMIDRVRTFVGFREHPKYGLVCRYAVYKQALLDEAERLVHAGVLAERDDLFFLTFQELRDVVRTGVVDGQLVRERKAAFDSFHALTPPRVLTSDGERLDGAYRRDEGPPGALVGLGVSSGIVEGRARVVLDISRAELEPGDILVTAFTDPSWTPLFVTIAGLVTEVGGLMTHGAVIAREYGLPAVVGVVGATRLIGDGQRIRVHGADGFVEILS